MLVDPTGILRAFKRHSCKATGTRGINDALILNDPRSPFIAIDEKRCNALWMPNTRHKELVRAIFTATRSCGSDDRKIGGVHTLIGAGSNPATKIRNLIETNANQTLKTNRAFGAGRPRRALRGNVNRHHYSIAVVQPEGEVVDVILHRRFNEICAYAHFNPTSIAFVDCIDLHHRKSVAENDKGPRPKPEPFLKSGTDQPGRRTVSDLQLSYMINC